VRELVESILLSLGRADLWFVGRRVSQSSRTPHARLRRASARHGGALVRLTLNRAARVTLTIRGGRRVAGTVAIAGKTGANAIRFAGRIGGHPLAPGRYQLLASAGSNSSSVSFEVKR
jgi:hypothetical protein